MTEVNAAVHSAADTALGFYFQTTFALLAALRLKTDEAAVCVEGLDDVQLQIGGGQLLVQLKHSMGTPAALTIKSAPLWRTLRAWINVLPKLSLSEARFQLVTVATLAADSPLHCLLEDDAPRDSLLEALVDEAERVVTERSDALVSGTNPKDLPHKDRFAGCETLLALDGSTRKMLLDRISIQPGTDNIAGVQESIREELTLFPSSQRKELASRLLGWWDLEMVGTLCKQREAFISREEVQQAISEFAAAIKHDILTPEFEGIPHPEDYQPHGMLAKQIDLVKGSPHDLRLAIREEWRAREQRSKWTNDRLGMATVITQYDLVLEEAWSETRPHG